MPTVSLRNAWAASPVPRPPLSGGLRAAAAAGPRAFPFRSLRRMAGSFRPTGGLEEIGKYPDDINVPRGRTSKGRLSGEVQGIAFDQHYQYLVTTDSIYAPGR
jgi:hypothetical protein